MGQNRLKTINACITLLLAGLLLIHVAYEIFSYATFYYNPAATKVLGFTFAAGVIAHAVISCYFLFIGHEAGKRRRYVKANLRTVLQRVSAFMILIFLPLHIMTGDAIASGKYTGHGTFILWMSFQVLFFFSIYLHVSASFTRALITLGLISKRKTKLKIDAVISAGLAIVFIAALIIIVRTQLVLYFKL